MSLERPSADKKIVPLRCRRLRRNSDLSPGGHVAFEVGEVRGGRLLLERLVWRAAEGLPFIRLVVMVNRQSFTKTANCWGVDNNRRGTNSNRIVLLRRC